MIYNEVYLPKQGIKLVFKTLLPSLPRNRLIQVYQKKILLFSFNYDERKNKIDKEIKIINYENEKLYFSFISEIISLHQEIISTNINYGQPYDKDSDYVDRPHKNLLIEDFFKNIISKNRTDRIDILME